MLNFWFVGILIATTLIYKLFKSRIKGFLGEKNIAIRLSSLNKSKYKVVNNLVLENSGKTCQIDHLIISDYGLFVIETKNLKGWIFGAETSEYWSQIIYKRKEYFYNPIRQNSGHIIALRNCLKQFPFVKYIPIVVFSNSATLKFRINSHVVYSNQLLKVIKQYSDVLLSEEDKDELYKIIKSTNTSNTYNRANHINSIKKRIVERDKLVDQDICPRCGGDLIMRRGKFGSFTGCNNFPRCKFIIN